MILLILPDFKKTKAESNPAYFYSVLLLKQSNSETFILVPILT